MRILALLLGIAAILAGLRFSGVDGAQPGRKIREWMEETHGAGFELRRHFFRRFFDSDLVAAPGQFQVVAIGVFAIFVSLSIIMTQAYYHKYRMLLELDSPEPYRLAGLADHLFLITGAMVLAGLITAVEWPSLFPGLRDYLVLAGLPLKTRDLFIAKFTALVAFMAIFIVGLNALPSVVLPSVMAGRYDTSGGMAVVSLFVSMSLGAWFFFFALVALQGVLLNTTSPRVFPGVSLFVQGSLVTVLVCALPLVLSIPSLFHCMGQRPGFALWLPPVWFLGLDQAMLGNREPFVGALAWRALAGLAAAALAAVTAYLWSYRRQKVRLLETPVAARHELGWLRGWQARWSDRCLPAPPEQAVFGFTAATLARSRVHRMVLTGFVALAVALIVESFVSLVFNGEFRGFRVKTFALEEATVAAPLALSLFVLAGLRYLFRLPVELRANWVFRVNETGNRELLLRGVDRFVLGLGVVPVALLTLPLELRIFGVVTGLAVAALAALASLTVDELLLFGFDRIPFTSSYLPGSRPLIETVCIYGAAVAAYVLILSGLIVTSVDEPSYYLIAFGLMLAVWARIRKQRLEHWQVGALEYEELAEPAVQTLAIYRD
ncbi:MAG TPA: hypothetical protein VME43_30770 [Bryobacteraceae bacterium]|nr:hypothetical protein [Bryobacteraceae bacterium]